jgi:suppressor of fused
MSNDSAAPGWEAIDRALEKQYPGQQPKHYGTIIKWSLGGKDPLDGLNVYFHAKPRPHWHYTTYGLSELYSKESEDEELSGYGFELTFRLACKWRPLPDEEPPMWPISFLQNISRYVFQTGNIFDDGHHMDLRGPIALESDTLIRAIAFSVDPELNEIETPHGNMKFLQVVGITLDELSAAQTWDTTKFLEVLARAHPLLITDLDRRSILETPARAAEIAEGAKRDGSSTDLLNVSSVEWTVTKNQLRIAVGASNVATLIRALEGRILHDRTLALIGPGSTIVFEPSDDVAWEEEDDGVLVLDLGKKAVLQLAQTLRPKRGEYEVPALPRVIFEVRPSEIKDAEGNVVEVIG